MNLTLFLILQQLLFVKTVCIACWSAGSISISTRAEGTYVILRIQCSSIIGTVATAVDEFSMLEPTREALSVSCGVGANTVHLVRLELPSVYVPVLVFIPALVLQKCTVQIILQAARRTRQHRGTYRSATGPIRTCYT